VEKTQDFNLQVNLKTLSNEPSAQTLSLETQPQIKLTQTVQKGGCAAKVSASELRQILARVRFPPRHPELQVDGDTFDDAAIYAINGDVSLVQTLDFFTPIVDSPYEFGAIAAANALSDVYAMGGQPKTAMAILAFPLASFTQDVIVEVLQGAADKITEAGANLVGGHSIDDDTLKFGLSVTGFVRPPYVWSNANAQDGDDLILTKPLGTGTATAALKRQAVTQGDISEEIDSMMSLNRILHLLSQDLREKIHAATDITGFGLLGHAMQMAQASKVQLVLEANKVPVFSQTRKFLQERFLTKAHRTNMEYVAGRASFDVTVDEISRLTFCDPQTSGGLLLAVDPKSSNTVKMAIREAFPRTEIIGKVQNQKETLCLQIKS
jgi:selenide,water dikinase